MEIGPVTNNEAIALRQLLASTSQRRKQREFLIEGPHLIESAIEAVPKLMRQVFATESAQLQHSEIIESLRRIGVTTRPISQKNAERISDTTTTQGFFALIAMAAAAQPSAYEKLVVALDNVQDPGNVGTIIRTAAWFGVHRIVATLGTADCYAPKVIRATQGALFLVEIEYTGNLVEWLREERRLGRRVIGSSLSERSQDLAGFRAPDRALLVLGSEAHGMSAEVERECDELVQIRPRGAGESLNVAVSAGILLDHLA